MGTRSRLDWFTQELVHGNKVPMTIRHWRAAKDRQLRELSLREAFDSQFPKPD